MEEYDYKLSRNNPALTAKVVSALVQIIRNQMQSDSNPTASNKGELQEFKYLKDKCIHGDPLISTTAALGLVHLVKSETIQITHTMSDLVAMIPLAKNCSGIVIAITELLIMDLQAKQSSKGYECPFNLAVPQHPLISVLLQDTNAWVDVLNYVTNHYSNANKKIVPYLGELLKPLYMFVLCDPFLKMPQLCRTKFFIFLTDPKRYCLDLLLDIISWLQISSIETHYYTSTFIIDLMASKCVRLDVNFQEFLLLWLTSVLYELCLNKQCIMETAACVSNGITELKPKCASVLLMILANCVSVVSVIYLDCLLDLCIELLKTNLSNAFALLSLRRSILNWSINPSILTDRSSVLMRKIYDSTYDSSEANVDTALLLVRNKYVSSYQNTNQHLHLAVELSILCEFWTIDGDDDRILKWLEHFQSISRPPIKYLQTFVFSLFLSERVGEEVTRASLNLLVKFVDADKDVANELLTAILYRLSNSGGSPKLRLYLLKALPKMGIIKENLHLLVLTLKGLSGCSSTLRTFVLSLFYELWTVEPKCYTYLQHLMTEGANAQDEEFNITKAHILKELCMKRSEVYGTELAAHLSKILNQCKRDSGVASAFALEGLKHLCIEGVIDIVTAWDSLANTFTSETRRVVIKSFCDLMGEVPNLCVETAKYKEMVGEVVSKLWWYTMNCPDIDIVESAYMALSAFSLSDLSGEFPDIYQAVQANKNENDMFTYANYEAVPGKWWLLVLQNSNRATISSAANLIITLASKEVSEYGRGIYTVPANRGEPHNYNALPESSIIRAIASYMKQQAREFDQDVDVMCLRILSHEYSKALPPYDWCFLQELVHVPEFRRYCIALASHQVVLSGTARRFIENFIVAVTSSASNLEDVTCVVQNLRHLCNSIQPSIVRPLIESSFRYALAIVESEGDSTFLDEVVFRIKDVLKREDLHEANKNVLFQIVTNLLKSDDVPPLVFEKLLECVSLLPPRQIRECTCLKQGVDLQDGLSQKAVKIHCTLAKQSDRSPLLWLNDIIDTVGLLETEEKFIREELIAVFTGLKDHGMAPNWILELMGQIQVSLAETQKFADRIPFMCDVLMVFVVVLSGHTLLLKEPHEVSDKKRIMFLFPQSLRTLLNQEKWHDYSLQMLEWLYHLINLEKIPEDYKAAFYQALVALRHQVTFKESLKWMKYVGCKNITRHINIC